MPSVYQEEACQNCCHNCARFRFYLRSLFLSVVYIWSRGSSDYTSSYDPPVHRSHLTLTLISVTHTD